MNDYLALLLLFGTSDAPPPTPVARALEVIPAPHARLHGYLVGVASMQRDTPKQTFLFT